MQQKKRVHPKVKMQLHPRNKHRARYDFKLLLESCPELAPFVVVNNFNDESIDFANPAAVKMLNKALLKQYYGTDNWDIPPDYLCPPIPGRADYIHNVADLLGSCNNGNIPTGSTVTCLDIGVGANCVYPIIGHKEYGWTFVGSDIDPVALASAGKIAEANPDLAAALTLRLQPNPKDIFPGIIQKGERFDLTICNPPFHTSMAEAQAGTLRKLQNLSSTRVAKPTLNFGGQNGELWCEGGEEGFVYNMVRQSLQCASSCYWFTTLISKHSHLNGLYAALTKAAATEVKTLQMGQGNKKSRVVAWTFLSGRQQKIWKESRWERVKPE